jgi:hypothetical protein
LNARSMITGGALGGGSVSAAALEGGEDGLMDLLGRPAADVSAACRRARELPSA